MKCPRCDTDMRCTGLTFFEGGAVQRYECRNKNCPEGRAKTAQPVPAQRKKIKEMEK